MPDTEPAAIFAELIAVVVAVTDGQPRVLTLDSGQALPSGPFETTHRSLQASLRSWVERQTHHPLGYIEQLYTFADRDRTVSSRRVVSVSYLGLTREGGDATGSGAWRDWYRYFPWEDRRDEEKPDDDRRRDTRRDAAALFTEARFSAMTDALLAWADSGSDAMLRWERRNRVIINFALEGRSWNDEAVLQRYETLWEAGLVAESGGDSAFGTRLAHDHRRILATGIARLRSKIKYRPVVFELMPAAFTLGQLQTAVEALAGRRLHKQNFRRLIEQQALVEDTGRVATETGGRPARLVRFRGEFLAERATAGTKLPLAR